MPKTPTKAQLAAAAADQARLVRRITYIGAGLLSLLAVAFIAPLAINSPLFGKTSLRAGSIKLEVARPGPFAGAVFDDLKAFDNGGGGFLIEGNMAGATMKNFEARGNKGAAYVIRDKVTTNAPNP